MKISELLKKSAYAVTFGFMGLIIGIWIADLLYSLILGSIDRVTTVYISVAIIILVVFSASFLGFTKGKSLLE